MADDPAPIAHELLGRIANRIAQAEKAASEHHVGDYYRLPPLLKDEAEGMMRLVLEERKRQRISRQLLADAARGLERARKVNSAEGPFFEPSLTPAERDALMKFLAPNEPQFGG